MLHCSTHNTFIEVSDQDVGLLEKKADGSYKDAYCEDEYTDCVIRDSSIEAYADAMINSLENLKGIIKKKE